jgi:hypothetical protein
MDGLGFVIKIQLPNNLQHLPESVQPIISRTWQSAKPHIIKPKLKLPIVKYPYAVNYHEAEASKVWNTGEGVESSVNFMQTYDDLFCRWARFYPTNEKAIINTILLAPGKSLPIEALQITINQFVQMGHQVFVMDWRSQGLSSRPYGQSKKDRQKVHVESFDQYGLDFAQFLETHVLPKKIGSLNVIAYSTGAAAVITALARNFINQNDIDYFAPVAPLVRAKDLLSKKGKIIARFASTAAALGYGYKYMVTTGERDWKKEQPQYEIYTLYRDAFDEVSQRSLEEPRILSGGQTNGWVNAYNDYAELTQNMGAGSIQPPVDLNLAAHDVVVSNKHAIAFFGHTALALISVTKLPGAHALELADPQTLAHMNARIIASSNAACLAAA